MGKKGFNKNKFWYGYKGEALFQQTFPKAKKLSKQADFKLNNCYIEIGRSRILERQIIVYFRKIFYNIQKEFHSYKEMDPKEFMYYFKRNQKQMQLVDPKKFFFVYFTNSLKHFALFTYHDLLCSEMKRKRNGEYYFDIKVPNLNKTMDLYSILSEELELVEEVRPKMDEYDYGYVKVEK